MNKKKTILIISAILLLIIIGLGVWLLQRSGYINLGFQKTNSLNSKEPFKVEYLSVQEKNKLGISPNLKVQSLPRGIYKIIKNNSDVVTDLSQLEAQRPPRPAVSGQK